MYSWFLLLPLAGCLLAVLSGGIGAVLAIIGLRRVQTRRRTPATESGVPPVLPGSIPPSASSSGCWGLMLKLLLAFSVASILMGWAGIWSMKFSFHYVKDPATEWSDGRAPELEPLIRKRCVPFLKSGKGVGMAVAVVTPTNSTIMTFGRASLSSSALPRADTLFELGSITKTFTAIALARAIERGAVQIDQPIQELLPPGVQLPQPAREVTLRQLTTHTSGFPRLADNGFSLQVLAMLLFGSDPYKGQDEASLVAAVRKVRLKSKPGTTVSYSNFAMMLLGDLLARKAGTNYEAMILQEICRPLGMGDTVVNPNAAQSARMAQAYRDVLRCGPFVIASRSDPWFLGSELGGAGGLRSTAADMLKYLQANMHPETQPIGSALRSSHEVLFKENERLSWGMNWIHLNSGKAGQPIIWHNGATGGFCTFIGFTEDSRYGVLVLSNSTHDVDGVARAILRDLSRPKAARKRG